MKKGLFLLALLCLMPVTVAQAALSCTVAATCTAPDVTVMKLYSTSGGHAETASGMNYSNLVCCSGVVGMTNLCLGTYDTVAQLSGTTNAHVEKNTQANYATDACLAVLTGTITVAYQASSCTGYDTTIASISGDTNAHIGDGTAYTTKICASVGGSSPTLSFNLSDNTIGFGTLSAGAARYATGDEMGAGTQTEANTLTASTNATGGYIISMQGSTLNAGSATITAIGATNTASSAGTEQFGLRADVTSGTGTVSSPYAAAGYAYDASQSSSDELATGAGDGTSTVFSLRYLANIDPGTESGSYSTVLTYIITGTF